MGKKPKDRRGRLTSPSETSSLRFQFVLPQSPFTGDTPIPFRKISGAQNMVPGMIPPGPLGPGVVQNFGLCHFTAAPGSDQPWQRVRDRRCAGRGRSENRREGKALPYEMTGKAILSRRRAGQCPTSTAFLTAPFGSEGTGAVSWLRWPSHRPGPKLPRRGGPMWPPALRGP